MYDFNKSIKQHQQWQKMFLAMLSSNNPVDDITTEHLGSSSECAFGKWLASEDSNYLSNNPDFQQLVEVHKNYHKQSEIIYSLVKIEKIFEVKEVMDDFLEISNELVRYLELLQSQEMK